MFNMAKKKKNSSEEKTEDIKKVSINTNKKTKTYKSIKTKVPYVNGTGNKTKSLKKDLLDKRQISSIIQNQDIDQMLDFLKGSKHINKQQIMNLDPYFLDQHEGGVDMFMRMALKLEPKNPTHHHNYALFLEIQKFYDKAKKEFKAAIKLDEENETFRMDYANLLYLLKDYDEAEKEYKAAAKLNPTNANVWTNLGLLYSNKNEVKKAESALKKAINIDPNYPLSYLNLLQLYRRNDMAAEAQSLFQKYKSLEVQDLGINILHLDHKNSKRK